MRHNDAVVLLRQVEGININAQDAQGKTALMHAVANSDAAMVKKLLDVTGIDVNAKDAQSKTAFDLLNFASAKKDAAARESNIAVLELFLQKKAKTTVRLYSNEATRIPDEIMAEALFNSALKSNIDAIRHAISLGYPLDSALSHAAKFLDSKLATPIESHSEIKITKAAMRALCKESDGLGNKVLKASARDVKIDVVRGLIAVTSPMLVDVNKVDVNAKDAQSKTALMHAAANGHVEIVKLLSAVDEISMEDTYAEDGDHSSPNKDTVLTIAAEKQKHDVVEFLLGHTLVTEKMVLAKGRMGVTAFSLVDFALAKNGSEILSLFLKKSANFSSNIMATVARSFWVFVRNVGSSLRRGLRRGLTSISSKVISDACYKLAISSGSKAIKHAINLGFSFRFHEEIMSFAVKAVKEVKDLEKRKNSIKTLLDIEPAVGVTTLMAAVQKKCFDSCQAIIEAGAKVNDAILLSALKIKAVNESFKFLELMLKTETSEEKVFVGPEVLMAAIEKECLRSVKLILANKPIGLDGMLSWWDRKNPLILAARKGNLAIVEALVGKGSDLHQVSSGGYGYTALSVATAHDNLSVVEFLTAEIISKSEEQDFDAVTFLKSALSAPYVQRVKAFMKLNLPASYKFLCSAKAMLEDKKKLDQDGLIWADDNNHKELADYLRKTLAVKIQALAKIQAFVRGIQARSTAAVKIQAFVRRVQARSAVAAGNAPASASNSSGDGFTINTSVGRAVSADLLDQSSHSSSLSGGSDTPAAEVVQGEVPTNSTLGSELSNTSFNSNMLDNLDDVSSLGSIDSISSLSGSSATPSIELVQGVAATVPTLVAESSDNSSNSNSFVNVSLSN